MTDQDLTPEQVVPIQMFRRRPAPAGFSPYRELRAGGSLLERGRNANGEYEIYSSGIVWCRDKDKREWIGLRPPSQRKATTMTDTPPTDERVKALVETLRPFSAAVFNDNGDVTISTGHLTRRDWLKLSAALRDMDTTP